MAVGLPGNGPGMTNSDKDLLTTGEGVDEGSAASTAEGAGTGSGGSIGSAPSAGVQTDSQPAPPADVDTAESRKASASDLGQQLEAGEG